jgi:uncharacterized protein (TIGR00730 family)
VPPVSNAMKSVCVFCGSRPGNGAVYAEAAKALARELVRRGLHLVYGGGNVGLMGIVADAVLDAGGEVVGVIPQMLVSKEIAHAGLTRLHVVGSMHERKALMAELSDAFVALPGGFGTLEEFCEIVTWSQLGLHPKPCGLLNVNGYYDSLLAFLDESVREGFVRDQHRDLVLVGRTPEEVFTLLTSYRHTPVQKLIEWETS